VFQAAPVAPANGTGPVVVVLQSGLRGPGGLGDGCSSAGRRQVMFSYDRPDYGDSVPGPRNACGVAAKLE
jgi:hypothetical protein